MHMLQFNAMPDQQLSRDSADIQSWVRRSGSGIKRLTGFDDSFLLAHRDDPDVVHGVPRPGLPDLFHVPPTSQITVEAALQDQRQLVAYRAANGARSNVSVGWSLRVSYLCHQHVVLPRALAVGRTCEELAEALQGFGAGPQDLGDHGANGLSLQRRKTMSRKVDGI